MTYEISLKGDNTSGILAFTLFSFDTKLRKDCQQTMLVIINQEKATRKKKRKCTLKKFMMERETIKRALNDDKINLGSRNSHESNLADRLYFWV